MIGCTIIPVKGAASQKSERCSTSAPKVCRILEAFHFAGETKLYPENPTLINICVLDNLGLEATALFCSIRIYLV
ncbi:hypothetical protein CS542_01980 [Pedobacter sp. IW39]|nr:hypothetical protein CS542_01980 [Pedobacter sp. IW39]